MIPILGATPLTAVLGSGVNGADHADMKHYLGALADLNLAVLFCLPGAKEPADMRTTRKRNADDKAARAEAETAGRRDFAKVKSPAGLALASTDKRVLNAYLKQYGVVFGSESPINLGIELGASRLVVVDCDTPEQRAAFVAWAGAPEGIPYTVNSPGKYDDATGQWVHHGGGHFYFTVPEGMELPTNLGSLTQDGWAVLWNRRYVLIPPSQRREGAYVLAGREYELPPKLAALIIAAGEAKAQRARAHDNSEDSDAPQIDAWAEATSWDSILEPAGWTRANRVDNCGCDVWTAPGVHSSPKSATTHDVGCSLGRYTEVNAPMHIWTDNPGEAFAAWIAEHNGSTTLSKLQAVAVTEYGGKLADTMTGLGLMPVADSITAEEAAGIADISTGVDVSHDNFGDITAEVTAAREITPTGHPVDPQAGTDQALPGVSPSNPFAHLAGAQPVADLITEHTGFQMEVKGQGATGGWTETPEQTDEFGTHPAILTVKCTCGQVVSKKTLRDGGSEFEKDADGVWWHVEFDPTDGEPDGGHLVFAEGEDPVLDGPDWSAMPAPEWQPGEPLADGTPTVESSFLSPKELASVRPVLDQAGEPIGVTEVKPTEAPPADVFGDDEERTTGVYQSDIPGTPVIAPFSYWRGMPPPEYIVDGLIENGGLSCLIGPPGIGKSTVALDIACAIATGQRWQGRRTLQTKVLYLPGEGMSGAMQRLEAWVRSRDTTVDDVLSNMLIGNGILQLGATKEAWAWLVNTIITENVGLVIFDTFARMSLGLEENSATDVGKAIVRFDQVRRLTNAGVLIVHHTGKGNPNAGRGSSALNGALDSEILVREATWVADGDEAMVARVRDMGRPLELVTTKQKNAEMLMDPIPLVSIKYALPREIDPHQNGAALITGPGGSVDPMDAEILLARPVPETVVETAIRIKVFLADYQVQGATRSEIASGMQPDAYTAQRRDAGKYWRRQVNMAVDLGLQYDLIATATGKEQGKSYIPGLATAEQARQLNTDSVITDTD